MPQFFAPSPIGPITHAPGALDALAMGAQNQVAALGEFIQGIESIATRESELKAIREENQLERDRLKIEDQRAERRHKERLEEFRASNDKSLAELRNQTSQIEAANKVALAQVSAGKEVGLAQAKATETAATTGAQATVDAAKARAEGNVGVAKTQGGTAVDVETIRANAVADQARTQRETVRNNMVLQAKSLGQNVSFDANGRMTITEDPTAKLTGDLQREMLVLGELRAALPTIRQAIDDAGDAREQEVAIDGLHLMAQAAINRGVSPATVRALVQSSLADVFGDVIESTKKGFFNMDVSSGEREAGAALTRLYQTLDAPPPPTAENFPRRLDRNAAGGPEGDNRTVTLPAALQPALGAGPIEPAIPLPSEAALPDSFSATLPAGTVIPLPQGTPSLEDLLLPNR